MNAEVVTQVLPDLLPTAVHSIQGKINVEVRVTVDSGGNVSNAEFESEGPSKYFSKAALDAAQKWKFKPGMKGGQAVNVRAQIEVNFRLL